MTTVAAITAAMDKVFAYRKRATTFLVNPTVYAMLKGFSRINKLRRAFRALSRGNDRVVSRYAFVRLRELRGYDAWRSCLTDREMVRLNG